MRHLTTLAMLTSLAVATRAGHMAIEAPVGTDLSGLAGALPDETLAQASSSGLAVVSFDGFVGAALAYCRVERRMASAPGATVTLVQDDGSVRSRSQPASYSDNVVEVDFASEHLPLPLAA